MADKLRDRVTKNLTPQDTNQSQVTPNVPTVPNSSGGGGAWGKQHPNYNENAWGKSFRQGVKGYMNNDPSVDSHMSGEPFVSVYDSANKAIKRYSDKYSLAPREVDPMQSNIRNAFTPYTRGGTPVDPNIPQAGAGKDLGGGGAWSGGSTSTNIPQGTAQSTFDPYSNQFIHGSDFGDIDYDYKGTYDDIDPRTATETQIKIAQGKELVENPNAKSTATYNNAMIENYRTRGVPDSDIQNIMSGIMQEQSLNVERAVTDLRSFITDVTASDKNGSGAKILDKYLSQITGILDQNKQDLIDRRTNASDDPALNSMLGVLNDEFSEMRKSLQATMRKRGLNNSGMGIQAEAFLSGKQGKAQQQMISQFISQVNSEVHQGLLALSGQRIALLSQFAGMEVNMAENVANRNLQKMQLVGNAIGEINKLYSDFAGTKASTALKVDELNLTRQGQADDRAYKSAQLSLQAQRNKIEQEGLDTNKSMLDFLRKAQADQIIQNMGTEATKEKERRHANESADVNAQMGALLEDENFIKKLNNKKTFANTLRDIEHLLWYEVDGKRYPTATRKNVIDPLYKRFHNSDGTLKTTPSIIDKLFGKSTPTSETRYAP